MKTNIRLCIIALVLCLTSSATAKQWLDVTSQFLSNPNFVSSNYDEWAVSGSANSITARAGCMEMWSGQMRMSKTINGVKNGHYRLSLQGLYRTMNHDAAYKAHKNGTEVIRGYMFANDVEKKLPCQYDWSTPANPGHGNYYADGQYFPNSMEAAALAFIKGGYKESLEFDVTNGVMTLGIYNDESVSDNWMVVDNIKIEMEIDGAAPTSSNVIINEVMPSNIEYAMSPAYNFDSWIELYNPSDADILLGGYYMSDDRANPLKWKLPAEIGLLPAKGYLTVWLGSNEIKHTQGTFKLDCEGGEILLADAEGNIVTSCVYPEAISDMSFARTTDGGPTWSWTSTPTAGKSNSEATYASEQLATPEVDKAGGLFTSNIVFHVSKPSGTTLRYTTDGTTPSMTNGATSQTGTFRTSTSTYYKFRLFADGKLPSPVVSRVAIKKDHDYTLPIISVLTDSRYLYDDVIGVYTRGTNGRTGNGQSSPVNWNMPWDRPVNFQYIDPTTSEAVVNQDVDFAISGGWTRANDVKSFKLKADRKYYNQNAFDYQFFSEKPFIKNKTLQVRGGGNDSWCRIKDAALQTILQNSGINVDVQSYQPAVHFINGTYKGIINVREPNNKDFAYSNFGYSKDMLEVFEMSPDSNAYMMLGSKDALERVYELSADVATNSANYDEIKRVIDIDEFINYMAAEIYLGSNDWPRNNFKAYRKADGGKYRAVVFDLDSAFGNNSNALQWIDDTNWRWFDYIYDEGVSRFEEMKVSTVFLNLLGNADFRQRFIDALSIMGGSVFDYDRAITTLTALGDRVRTVMSWEGKNPDGSLNGINSSLKDRNTLIANAMKAYSRLNLKDLTAQKVKISANADGAHIFINQAEVPYAQFDGYLFSPTKLAAIAPAGYKFDGWKKIGTSLEEVFAYGSAWKYNDKGSLQNAVWNIPTYNDMEWQQGNAPLGYGKDLIATTIDYGTNPNNKRPTYYFRKKFTLADAPTGKYILDFTVDDGFVLYVNGKEAGRYNLGSGTITYDTYARTADGNPDKGSLTLSASLFTKGDNLIAVEVHNNNANSTDIVWDATLHHVASTDATDITLTDDIIDLPSDSEMQLTACFTKMTDAERKAASLHPVMINEVSAANGIYVNDYFKRNDWVELYNTTDDDIDIEGMYLTDNPSKPHKYRITKGNTTCQTVIPAHGFTTIWCDKLDPKSMLHASFKLAASGGQMMLTAADDSWSDMISYPAHGDDQTVGRYPDGARNVYVMDVPTINKSNMYTSYMTEVEQDDPSGVRKPSVGSDSEIEIRFAGNNLIIERETASPFHLNIYSLQGELLYSHAFNSGTNSTMVSIAHLAPGCYIAKATDSEGHSSQCKFMR